MSHVPAVKPALMQLHQEHLAQLRDRGVQLATYRCPQCGFAIECAIPSATLGMDGGLRRCPSCEQLHAAYVQPSGEIFVQMTVAGARRH